MPKSLHSERSHSICIDDSKRFYNRLDMSTLVNIKSAMTRQKQTQ